MEGCAVTNGAVMRAIRAIRRDWLDQPVLTGIECGLFVIGVLFWVEARLVSEAFNAEIYGDFALQYPAELWAGAMMGGAAMTMIGLRDPVKRGMVAAGSLIMTAMFLGLAYSAIATGGELIIGAFCSVLFAPLHARMAWEALRDAD
jgi:hypothetical protein